MLPDSAWEISNQVYENTPKSDYYRPHEHFKTIYASRHRLFENSRSTSSQQIKGNPQLSIVTSNFTGNKPRGAYNKQTWQQCSEQQSRRTASANVYGLLRCLSFFLSITLLPISGGALTSYKTFSSCNTSLMNALWAFTRHGSRHNDGLHYSNHSLAATFNHHTQRRRHLKKVITGKAETAVWCLFVP